MSKMSSTQVLALLALCAGVASAAKAVRPATVSFPLFVGVIDLRTTPGADDPKAPATIKAKGLARRAAGYPPAPALSVAPMERLAAAAAPHGGPPAGDGAFSAAPLLNSDRALKPRFTALPTIAAAAGAREAGGLEAQAEQEQLMQQEQEQEQQEELAAAAAAAPGGVAAAALPAAGARRLLDAPALPRLPLRRRAASARGGFPAAAPAGAYAGGGGGGPSLAASDTRAVHVTEGVVAIYSLTPPAAPAAKAAKAQRAPGAKSAAAKAGASRNGTLAVVRLQDLFAPVGSSNCRDGVYDAHAVFDASARRFYVAAACGGTGSALLAVSATAEPFGAWYLYNLNADGLGTPLACANGEAALVDYPRLNYNADALALSLHSYCPTAGGGRGAPGAGAALLVLPKGALARGESRLSYPVFTSAEVAAAAGGAVGADAIMQLEPALPQRGGDVAQGSMYFVADVSGPAVPRGTPRRSLLLVALANTGAMWGFTATAETAAGAAVPLLATAAVGRGEGVAAPREDAVMQQSEGPDLPLSGLPAGFWSGRAVWAGGKVFAADEAAADSGRPAPTVAWAVLAPRLELAEAGPCTSTAAWGAGFDFSADSSAKFGAAVQPAWEAFVGRAVNASGLRAQVAAAYGPRAAADRAGRVVAAGGDAEVAEQLARTDVSPFFVPVRAIPKTSSAADAPPGQLAAAAVYGKKSGGRGGFEGWSCWSCAPGKGGYVVSAAQYNFGGSPGYSGLNLYGGTGSGYFPGGAVAGTNGWRNSGWGGGPAGNFGPGPYGGGYGTGGWGGGYFGGFFSGSNVGGINWGSSCQIMCQRAWQGTGGVYGWGTGLAPSGWGPFGVLPFGLGGGSRGGGGWGGGGGGWGGGGGGGGWGGLGGWGRRRLAQAGDEPAAAAAEASGAIAAATAAGDLAAAAAAGDVAAAAVIEAAAAAASGIAAAQVAAVKTLAPVCVAPAATCRAAAAAACPAGAEPEAALSAALLQHGVVAAHAAGGLGLAAPALAVSQEGGMLILATYSGLGRVRGSAGLAYPGLASVSIAPGSSAATLRVEQRGTQPLALDAARGAGAWPAPPAAAAQEGGGGVYVTANKLPGSVGAWVSILRV
ncbi:MAG: hypothetical protein J3K34DRAFT_517876 [Monoraphidium minutum]|nr:MAG: hypothetical protein J3K34DRAFT_517876 [Monoraphidium minutum]